MVRMKLGSHQEEDDTFFQEKQVTIHQGSEFLLYLQRDQVSVYSVRVFDLQAVLKVLLSVMIREHS